jgi:hypothetical protein
MSVGIQTAYKEPPEGSKKVIRVIRRVVFAASLLLVAGCASFRPVPLPEVPFKDRAITQVDDKLRVTVAVLSPEEGEKVFGVDVAGRDVQPVWIEIENKGEDPYWLFQSRMDPDYYSPAEVAYMNRFRWSPSKNERMRDHFESLDFPVIIIPPGKAFSGFIHTRLDPGLKYVNVSLFGFKGSKNFHFVVKVPGIEADYQEVNRDALYSQEEYIDCDEERLRAELEKLPCCTTNKSGTRNGDPLNLVLMGDVKDLVTALIGGGWDATERMSLSSVWRTVKSSIFGNRYRHAPVSPLYVFGRRQDAAFQKARGTVDNRNHLRVWLTRLRFNGLPVWIGQISRDIGVKLTLKTGTLFTHVIDPDVDNDRYYLMQNFADAQALASVGYVKGVGVSASAQPRYNLGGDPYSTDGLRAVMHCTDVPVEFSDIQLINWDWSPRAEPYVDAIMRSRSEHPPAIKK